MSAAPDSPRSASAAHRGVVLQRGALHRRGADAGHPGGGHGIPRRRAALRASLVGRPRLGRARRGSEYRHERRALCPAEQYPGAQGGGGDLFPLCAGLCSACGAAGPGPVRHARDLRRRSAGRDAAGLSGRDRRAVPAGSGRTAVRGAAIDGAGLGRHLGPAVAAGARRAGRCRAGPGGAADDPRLWSGRMWFGGIATGQHRHRAAADHRPLPQPEPGPRGFGCWVQSALPGAGRARAVAGRRGARGLCPAEGPCRTDAGEAARRDAGGIRDRQWQRAYPGRCARAASSPSRKR